MPSTIYLVPSVLDDAAIETIPSYIIDAVRKCSVIFAENERTARRFLKSICREIVIDDYEWFTIHKAENEVLNTFRQKIKEEKNITTAQLSIVTHIPQPNITHMETMKAKPNLRTLVKICHALDIHLDLKERK